MHVKFMLVASAVLFAPPLLAQEADWQADALARAAAFHAANLPEACIVPDDTAPEPISWELQVGEDTAARQALIVEFTCQRAAYNQTAVYLLSDQHGKVSEIVFPSPQIDLACYGENESAAVEKISITEIATVREVLNPNYDPSSRTMTERNLWRGVGDAYTTTHWGFKNGKFEIMHFAVDASYDGKDNPQTLIAEDVW